MSVMETLRGRLRGALARPEVRLVPLAEGMDCRVFAVDDDLVARVGRLAEAAQQFSRAARLQGFLAVQAPAVAISKPVLQLPADPTCGPVAVEQRLFGTPWVALTAPQRRDHLGDVVTACRTLHQVPWTALPLVEEAQAAPPWAARYAAAQETTISALGSALPPSTLRYLRARLAALMVELARHAVPEVLLHGDLTAENLLVRDAEPRIGLLDFGDAQLGDPAYDLRCFQELWSAKAIPHVIATYDPTPTFARRVSLYRELLPLEIAGWGHIYGDRELVTRALHQLQAATQGQSPW